MDVSATSPRRRRDYWRRDRDSEEVSETSPRLVGDLMETSPRLPNTSVAVRSRRRRLGVSASNFRFHKSPESPRLISCGSRGDVSATSPPVRYYHYRHIVFMVCMYSISLTSIYVEDNSTSRDTLWGWCDSMQCTAHSSHILHMYVNVSNMCLLI